MRTCASLLLAVIALTSTVALAQTAPQLTPEDRAARVAQREREAAAIALEHPLMPIGSSAPDFSLTGTDDKTHTLAEFSKGKLLVVMFESVHCPVSENYEGRMHALYETYHGKGVEFVAINPNNPKAVRLDELGYTDLTDAPSDMKIRVKDRHIPWPYLYDGETQSTAQKFGGVATPHVFIFDQRRKLRYEGRIDDNQNEKLVKVHDAQDAIDALLSGGAVAVAHRPAFGCSTKWIAKSADVQREADRIQAEPVDLKSASLDELKAVFANAGNKVTVVHFWNTGNKGEANFQALQTTYFMYRGRAYNFVTINTDSAAKSDKAKEFLKSHRASATNLQISPADFKAIQDSFGTKWNLAEEFTAVIAPGGKVVYAKKGSFDILEVRHAVLANFTDNPGYPGQAIYWASR